MAWWIQYTQKKNAIGGNRKVLIFVIICERIFYFEKMASDAVLKYLVDTNRPYSCADVTVNLRGAYTKGAVQKALDALSDNAKIKCKLYGKQKVYSAIQPGNTEGDSDVEGKSLNTTITKIFNVVL